VAVGGGAFGAPVNLYAPRMTPREVDLGPAPAGGTVPVIFQMDGKDPQSRGYQAGIDAFVLKPAP
jgi:hypothetical protein